MLQVIVRARQCIIEDPYNILDDIHDLSPAAKDNHEELTNGAAPLSVYLLL